MRNTFSNIILIGMAGAGKSTVGAVLASLAKKQFIDTDDLISEQTGMVLQDFLNSVGQKTFQHQEEQTLLSITLHDHVIATGGSAVYSSAGMRHLQKLGPIVLLEVDLETLEQRVDNKNSRGIVNPGKGSFRDLFYSRQPLYRRWADIRINGSGPPDDIARSILKKIAATKNS
ncbi:MAG: shikimate kinase [Desulfobulbaceae bacterium]|nr:shikimate kinase [Desulfobulbaceae bacterium]